MLEAVQHTDNAFVTLTYADEHLPGMGSLEPKHLRYWLDAMRKVIGYGKLRFYAVGEYGDETNRPHYHVALFGFPPCKYGRSRYSEAGGRQNCCSVCDTVRDTWGRGNIDVGELTESSAQYIAGYVLKKLNRTDDPRLRPGCWPEFSRMSKQNGGIGAGFIDEYASTLMTFNLEDASADVPSALRHGSRLLPLGGYLHRRLRKRVGRDEKTPPEVLQQRKEELQTLRENKFGGQGSLKTAIIEENAGSVASLIARSKIRKQKRTL